MSSMICLNSSYSALGDIERGSIMVREGLPIISALALISFTYAILPATTYIVYFLYVLAWGLQNSTSGFIRHYYNP